MYFAESLSQIRQTGAGQAENILQWALQKIPTTLTMTLAYLGNKHETKAAD